MTPGSDPTRHFRAFIEEPMLWPVLGVVLAHVVLGIALVLLAAFRGRSGFALAALAGLVVLTADIARRTRRRGRALIAAAVLWSLAGVTAVVAAHFGLL